MGHAVGRIGDEPWEAGIQLDHIGHAVVVCVDRSRIRPEPLLVQVAHAVVVGVLKTVQDEIRIGVLAGRISAGQILVVIGQPVTVLVVAAIRDVYASHVGELPPVGHAVVIAVQVALDRTVVVEVDELAVADQHTGVGPACGPVAEVRAHILLGGKTGIVKAEVGHEIRFDAGQQSGHGQHNVAIRPDRAPHAHFIDRPFEALADPRVVGAGPEGDRRTAAVLVTGQLPVQIDRETAVAIVECDGHMRPFTAVNRNGGRGRRRKLSSGGVGVVSLNLVLVRPRSDDPNPVVDQQRTPGGHHALDNLAAGLLRKHPGLEGPALQRETAVQRQLDVVTGAVEVHAAHHDRAVAVGRVVSERDLLAVEKTVVIGVLRRRVGPEKGFLRVADAVLVVIFVAIKDAVVVAVGIGRVRAQQVLEEINDLVVVRIIVDTVVQVRRVLARQIGGQSGHGRMNATMPHTARVKLDVVTADDHDAAVHCQFRIQFHHRARP